MAELGIVPQDQVLLRAFLVAQTPKFISICSEKLRRGLVDFEVCLSPGAFTLETKMSGPRRGLFKVNLSKNPG